MYDIPQFVTLFLHKRIVFIVFVIVCVRAVSSAEAVKHFNLLRAVAFVFADECCLSCMLLQAGCIKSVIKQVALVDFNKISCFKP